MKEEKCALNGHKRQTDLQEAVATVSKFKVNIENKDKLLKKSLNRMQLYRNMLRSY